MAVIVQAQAGIDQADMPARGFDGGLAFFNFLYARAQALQHLIGKACAVIADGQDQLIILNTPRHGQAAQLVLSVKAVGQRVFNQRLQRQLGHGNRAQVFGHVDGKFQVVFIPRLGQHQIAAHVFNLLGHGGGARAGIGGIAQHLSKLIADFDHLVIAAFHGFCADDIERIIDKMRVDLRLQGAELGMQRALAQRQLVGHAVAQAKHQMIEHLLELIGFAVPLRGDGGKQLLIRQRAGAEHAVGGHLTHLPGQLADRPGQADGHQHNH